MANALAIVGVAVLIQIKWKSWFSSALRNDACMVNMRVYIYVDLNYPVIEHKKM